MAPASSLSVIQLQHDHLSKMQPIMTDLSHGPISPDIRRDTVIEDLDKYNQPLIKFPNMLDNLWNSGNKLLIYGGLVLLLIIILRR